MTVKKDDEKAPPKQHSFYKKRHRRKDYTACLPLHNRAIILSRALTSHHLLLLVVSRSPKLFLLLSRAAFHWGRKRLNRMYSKDWAAEPCFTSLQTSHKPVNKPTGGKRTAL